MNKYLINEAIITKELSKKFLHASITVFMFGPMKLTVTNILQDNTLNNGKYKNVFVVHGDQTAKQRKYPPRYIATIF